MMRSGTNEPKELLELIFTQLINTDMDKAIEALSKTGYSYKTSKMFAKSFKNKKLEYADYLVSLETVWDVFLSPKEKAKSNQEKEKLAQELSQMATIIVSNPEEFKQKVVDNAKKWLTKHRSQA
jgi:arsenate reductase-like glutaredoxin family protein